MTVAEPNRVPAHEQAQTHRYQVHYGEHYPRETDRHYHLFEAYRRRTKDAAACFVGQRIGAEHCRGRLELHHAHLEFAAQSEASWQAVARDFPAVHDRESLAAWAESADNFRWLCVHHHRSAEAGAHSVSHADWEAGLYTPRYLL